MERAVKRELARRQAEPIRHLGVDEKAFRKGHKYMTVVNDLVRGRVLYVAEDRKQESLNGFWGTLTEGQRKGIRVVPRGIFVAAGETGYDLVPRNPLTLRRFSMRLMTSASRQPWA